MPRQRQMFISARIQTVTHDGLMGIAPAGKMITMRSLDFWRLENGKIRENWVMVDILAAYRQPGVGVFPRLREFNKSRVPGPIALHIRDSPTSYPALRCSASTPKAPRRPRRVVMSSRSDAMR